MDYGEGPYRSRGIIMLYHALECILSDERLPGWDGYRQYRRHHYGASVKATNDNTGVVSAALSNEAGACNFASLIAGVYPVSAEHTGFRIQTYTKVDLGSGAQRRRADHKEQDILLCPV